MEENYKYWMRLHKLSRLEIITLRISRLQVTKNQGILEIFLSMAMEVQHFQQFIHL